DDDLDFGAWWLWPNVNFVVNPGESNVVVMHMMPSGPETTIEHLDFYFLTEKPSEQQRAVIEYFGKVLNPEDVNLVESVQRGLHSRGYHQSRYIVDRDRTELSEHAVHHFHSLVLDALKG
ncbi:MAG: SRPBCC family protein, partial [Alphaproteobacteria bacterium]